jgi:hypothetical protein
MSPGSGLNKTARKVTYPHVISLGHLIIFEVWINKLWKSISHTDFNGLKLHVKWMSTGKLTTMEQNKLQSFVCRNKT